MRPHANPMPTPCGRVPKKTPGTKKEKKRRDAGCYLLIYLLLIPSAQ
jgi:hypothetical protein